MTYVLYDSGPSYQFAEVVGKAEGRLPERDSSLQTPQHIFDLYQADSASNVPSGSVPVPRPSDTDRPRARPSIKIKEEEALILPPDAVARYLQGTPNLTINPAPSSLHVKRKLLRQEYGGSDQQFVQYIQPKRNPSNKNKKRCLVFPMPVMNPAMPLSPGEPGLLFASRHEVLDGQWGVFRRHLNGKDALWLYLGEYEKEMENIKQGKGRDVSEETIIEAFSRGDEGIDIIRMQCVAYDHTFSRDIEERYCSRLKLESEEGKLEENSTKFTNRTASSATSSSTKGEADEADSVLNASESSYVSPSTSPQPGPPFRRSQRTKTIRNRWRVQSSSVSEAEDDMHGFDDAGGKDDGNVTDGGLSYVDSD
ncbi:hypothetical protein H1R20_g12189, partial [Candolleomyces eurysporus]